MATSALSGNTRRLVADVQGTDRHRDLLAVAVHPLKHSTFGRIARQL
jgi:hypothetical protein